MTINELFRYTLKSLRHEIAPKVKKQVDFALPSWPMVDACRTATLATFQPWIAAGRLTVAQMQRACRRYHLGQTKSGQPIYWMIDDLQRPLDAHIGTDSWLSQLLKTREPLISNWCVEHCLFGLHLRTAPDLSTFSSICVVESESSAVILSELFPEVLWMAWVSTAHLSPSLFYPLEGSKVIIYPRTDPCGSSYLFFQNLAALVRRQRPSIAITVDSILEKHASQAQKARGIDLLDFLFTPP